MRSEKRTILIEHIQGDNGIVIPTLCFLPGYGLDSDRVMHALSNKIVVPMDLGLCDLNGRSERLYSFIALLGV